MVNEREIKQAAKCIKEGELVIFPTETVYGLGADAFNPEAVSKIYEAKGRPKDNPLIVHISNYEQLDNLGEDIPDIAMTLCQHFWPGPLTIVIKRKKSVSSTVSAGGDTIAVRMPSHQVIKKLIDLSNTPIAAPSANLSGKVSPTDDKYVSKEIVEKACAFIRDGQCNYGVESTVVNCTGSNIEILRPGSITLEQLKSVMNKSGQEVYRKTLGNNYKILSPGTTYKHYAPETKLLLINRDKILNYLESLNKSEQANTAILATEEVLSQLPENMMAKTIPLGTDRDLNEVARNLFANLNKIDEVGISRAVIHEFPPAGIGAALMDRIMRASVAI
jgi:L-threonylcarbamoyladenylate synthase